MITTPKPSLELIINDAFSYWKKTLSLQLLFSLIFFTILFSVVFFASQQLGIMDQYMEIFKNNEGDMMGMQNDMKELVKSSEYLTLGWIIIATSVFLFPLNVGFFKVYKKLDLNENVQLQDLFSGYSGINFFIYISYYLFWSIIYNYTMPTIVLGIVWVLITLFTTPLMFFNNKKIFESIKINFQILKSHFGIVALGVLVAVFIKYAGIFVFGFGILLTYPFVNAMIYSLYKNLVAGKLDENLSTTLDKE